MLNKNGINSKKTEYEKERDKIEKCAKIMKEKKGYVNGYVDPYKEKELKSELKLDDRQMALVFNELGIEEAKLGNYNYAESLLLAGIKYDKHLPILHHSLGVIYVKLYETKGNEKELIKAKQELKKAKFFIEEQNLEQFLSTELNSIKELLEYLNPPWTNYPNILRRAIISWLEKIIAKLSINNTTNNNNQGANIGNFSNQVQGNASQQANQHIDNENKNN